MTKEDRRIRRTQRALSQALMDLSAEQGYESISIRELTDRASVGYATFFRHYKSKDELLLAMLTELIDDFVGLLPDPSSFDGAKEKGLILFEYVDQHTELCQLLLGSQGSSLMALQLHRLATEISASALATILPLPDELPLPVVANHIVASIFGMVRWWLDQGKPHTPEEMATMYEALIFAPLASMESRGHEAT